MNELIESIIEDLTSELTITDPEFDLNLLTIKVNNAAKEVKRERRYPSSYTEEQINSDMENFYDIIRNLALYDYVTIGDEFQDKSTENSVTRGWVDRKSLFAGLIPLAKF